MQLQTQLSFLYRMMVASERLLERAIELSRGSMRDYFKEHLEEERGHAEMLANDLARLGVEQIPHFNLAALIVGAQYYFIEHEHPAALFGYMAALEGKPIPLALVDALEKEHGKLHCLRHHAVHDPRHIEDLREQIDALPEPLKLIAARNEQLTLAQLDSVPHFLESQGATCH